MTVQVLVGDPCRVILCHTYRLAEDADSMKVRPYIVFTSHHATCGIECVCHTWYFIVRTAIVWYGGQATTTTTDLM